MTQREIDAPIIVETDEGEFHIVEDPSATNVTLVFQKVIQEQQMGTGKKISGKANALQNSAILTISNKGDVDVHSISIKKNIVAKAIMQLIEDYGLVEEDISVEEEFPQDEALNLTPKEQFLGDEHREVLRDWGLTEEVLSILTKYLSAMGSSTEELRDMTLKELCDDSYLAIPEQIFAENPFVLFDSQDEEKLEFLGENKDLLLFSNFHLKISALSIDLNELLFEAHELDLDQENNRSFTIFYDSTGKINQLQVDGQFYEPLKLSDGEKHSLMSIFISAKHLIPSTGKEVTAGKKKKKKKSSPPSEESSFSESIKKSNEGKSNSSLNQPSLSTVTALVKPSQKMDNLLEKLSADQTSSLSIHAAMAWMDDAIRSKVGKVVGIAKGGEGLALQEALGHLFLAGCGFEQFAISIENGRVEEALALFPMLLIDWHVELEQIITKYLRALKIEYPENHSLVQLIETCNQHKQLKVTLNDIEGIDRALIWSRYPSNMLQGENPPEAIKWIRFCQRALRNPNNLDRDELTQFLNYVLKTHHQTLFLLVDLLELEKEVNKADIDLILSLFNSSDVEGVETAVIETRLQGALDIAYDNIQSGSSTRESPLTKEIDKLLAKIQTYSKFVPNNYKKEIEGSLINLEYHLRRLRMTSLMGEENKLDYLKAWHTRNAMNIQWVLEEILRIKQLLATGTLNHGHAFKSFMSSKEKQKATQLDEGNYKIGSHYPVAFGQKDRRFGTYLNLLEQSRYSYIVEEGFKSAQQMRHKERETQLDKFRQETENILPMIQKANQMMDEIMKL